MKHNKTENQAMRDKAMEIYYRFSGFNLFNLPDEYLLAVNFVEILIENDREYVVMRDNSTVIYLW